MTCGKRAATLYLNGESYRVAADAAREVDATAEACPRRAP
jgi:hypothetical protein